MVFVIRTVVGFHQDDVGDWVAGLSCLHGQHVRHQPPFQERLWVMDESGRAARIGSELNCPLCDRAELPEGLRVLRTAGPFDATTVPPGLRASHLVAAGMWGRLQVLEGAVGFSMETDPLITRRLVAGDEQAIPPGVAHRLSLEGPVRLTVDFLGAEPTST
jgi:tellurite methyltransferase